MTLEQLKTLLKKLRIRKNTELFKNTYILKYNIFIIIYLHPWEDLLCILPQELLIDVHLEARGLSELSFFFFRTTILVALRPPPFSFCLFCCCFTSFSFLFLSLDSSF